MLAIKDLIIKWFLNHRMELKTWKKTQISGTSITMLIIGRKKKHHGSYSTVHIHCHMSAFLPKLFRHCILYIQRFTQRYMYHEGSMYFQRSWFTKQLPVESLKEGVFVNDVFLVLYPFNSCSLSFKLQPVLQHLQEFQFMIYFYQATFRFAKKSTRGNGNLHIVGCYI